MINNYFECQYRPYHQVYTHASGCKIYLGDIAAAMDLDFIKKKQISIVVTAALGMEHISYQPRIQHVVYPLLDKKSQNMTKYFPEFYQLTEKQIQTKNILVHCFAGISRSATLVISYLMKKHVWSFKDAISFVRKSKPNVLPNLGFERQLKEYEKQLQNLNKVQARKTISKTSQSRKYSKENKNRQYQGLPQIYALGKTLVRSKLLDAPGSQMEARKPRLPQFIDAGFQEKKNNNFDVKNFALKSFRKRSISQAHKKAMHNEKSERFAIKREGLFREGLAINAIKFESQKRNMPQIYPYHGV